MRPDQELEAESGSTAFQAGRDNNVINVGMTYEQAEQLVLKISAGTFLRS
jgi:hypothetical protein